MENISKMFGRRNFIKTTATLTSVLAGMTILPKVVLGTNNTPEENINLIGPKEGYSPQIGTLVSMLSWMRMVVISSVTNMSRQELDYLHDAHSNTIGAMLLHLAATEVFYQGNTFEGISDFKKDEKAKWSPAMNLGDEGRKMIKGNDLNYYINILRETREKTLTELKRRDDKWLMSVDPRFFGNQPTNNYCKWFHVCEHESNHNGQIKWIKGRLPGSKVGNE